MYHSQNRTIRIAVHADIDAIMPIIDQARSIMRANGNRRQWINGYPQRETIVDDIAHKRGRVVADNGTIVAYFALMEGPDPTYRHIEGPGWIDEERPYHVVHRIASTPVSHGIMQSLLHYCFSMDSNIRIDTHADNTIMQHILEQNQFTHCGTIYVDDGSPRRAYQRICPSQKSRQQ